MDDPPGQVLPHFDSLQQESMLLLGLLFFFCLNLILSAIEGALASLKPQDLEQFNRSGNNKGKLILDLLSRPRVLSTTLVVTNRLVKAGLISVSALIFLVGFTDLTDIAIVTYTATVAFIFACSTFIARLGLYAYRQVILRMASTPLKYTTKVFKPLCNLLIITSRVVERKFEIKQKESNSDELNHTFELVTDNNNTPQDEKEILKSIVNFGKLTVKQVMQSRLDIHAVNRQINFHELLNYINKSGYSRIPVFVDTIDRIEGVLYTKDLLPFINEDKHFNWRKFLRSPLFTPETKRIDSLLKDFKEKRIHIALVVNEYGGISGLITLEDIIEIIIGDISDEFDEVALPFKKIDDNTFVFEGKTSLHDFCKVLEINSNTFDEVKGESE